jgi:hypothetical protein
MLIMLTQAWLNVPVSAVFSTTPSSSRQVVKRTKLLYSLSQVKLWFPFGMQIYLKIQIKDEAVLLFLPLFTSLHHTHLTLPQMLGSLAPPPAAAATL